MATDVDYLAVGIEEALDRYPLINLERGEYDAIAGTAAQACVDAGFVPTASAERVAELEREHAAFTTQTYRLRGLLNEWESGENSASDVEPGIAYCARELRRVMFGGD